jgi:hypothetical protein
LQGDSDYEADDDESVGDDDEVYHGQPLHGDEAGIQVVLLLGDDEVGFVSHHGPFARKAFPLIMAVYQFVL